MAFNLPTYTGGQRSRPITRLQNITNPNNPTDCEYTNAIAYNSEVVNFYGKLTQSLQSALFNYNRTFH